MNLIIANTRDDVILSPASESVEKKLLSVLRASVVYLFLSISTRRHGDHGVYTERSDFFDTPSWAWENQDNHPGLAGCVLTKSHSDPDMCFGFVILASNLHYTAGRVLNT